jgi:hypothetical protein
MNNNWQLSFEKIFERKQNLEGIYFDEFISSRIYRINKERPYLCPIYLDELTKDIYYLLGRGKPHLSLGKHKLSEYISNIDKATNLIVGIFDEKEVAHIGKEIITANKVSFRKYNFEGNLPQGYISSNRWSSGSIIKQLNKSPFLDDEITIFDDLKKIIPAAASSIDTCVLTLSTENPVYDV